MTQPLTLPIDEYIKLPVPTQRWIIPGLLPAQSFTVLWGPPKSGKTLLALHAALAIANATPFLGTQCVGHGRVLLVELDTSHHMLHSMLCNLRQIQRLQGPVYIPDPQGMRSAYPLNLLTEASSLYLHSLIMESQPDLVIVDCLSELGNQDENQQGDMKQIISALKRLTVFHPTHPSSCLLIHHTVKFEYQNKNFPIPSTLKAGRGSGYLAGAADAVWFLHRLTSDSDPHGVLKIVPRYAQPSTIYVEQGIGGWWSKTNQK